MVSIIIPLYNSQQFIGETIRSCQDQTFTDIEIIVIDDCSSDNSAQIVQSIALDDQRIQYRCNDVNLGVIKTINNGIKLSKGEYIIVLGNDDMLRCRHIETAMEIINNNDKISFIHFSSDLIDENGKVFGERVSEDINGKYCLFARKNPINICGAVINAELLKQVGGFPAELGFRNYGEWYLWIELLSIKKCLFSSAIRSLYRIHSNNLTKKLFSKENIKSTRDYSVICMKAALNLEGINLYQRIKYTVFRCLYWVKMTFSLFITN